MKSLKARLRARDGEMRSDRDELKRLLSMLSDLVVTVMRNEQKDINREERAKQNTMLARERHRLELLVAREEEKAKRWEEARKERRGGR